MRFFLISRKADTEFVFDVDLALTQSDDNPVYYVQYAHARICSVLSIRAQRGAADADRRGATADLARLVAPSEIALLRQLAAYPQMLARRAQPSFAPHDVAFYLRDLAAAFHSYYACRTLPGRRSGADAGPASRCCSRPARSFATRFSCWA